MPLSVIVTTGYNFSDGEKVTYPKLNLLGTPSVTFTGELSSAQLSDGSVTTNKLEQGININSKINDHNLNLTKLEAGTQGQILYYNTDGDLVKLAPGTDGQFLRTKGSSAAPEWASQAGLSSVPYTDITTNGVDKYLTTDSSGNIEWINKPNTNSVSVYDTSDLAAIIAAGSPYTATQAHGFGDVPEQVVVTLRCTADDTSNTGYVVGDEVLLSGTHCNKKNSQGEIPAASAIVDSTNVVVQVTDEVRSDASKFMVYKKSDASQVGIGSSANKFVFRIRVWESGFSSSGTNAGPLTSEPGYYFTSTSITTLNDILTGSQSNWTVSFNHGFGSIPKLSRVVAVCTATDNDTGYVAGDEVDIVNLYRASSGGSYPSATVTSSLGNVRIAFAEASSSYLTIQHKTSANWVQMSSASKSNFKLKLYAWK